MFSSKKKKKKSPVYIALVRGQYYIYRMRTCVVTQVFSPVYIALVRGQYYIYRMRTCVVTQVFSPVLPLYEVNITFIVCVRA